jgi:hypothetical protein
VVIRSTKAWSLSLIAPPNRSPPHVRHLCSKTGCLMLWPYRHSVRRTPTPCGTVYHSVYSDEWYVYLWYQTLQYKMHIYDIFYYTMPLISQIIMPVETLYTLTKKHLPITYKLYIFSYQTHIQSAHEWIFDFCRETKIDYLNLI